MMGVGMNHHRARGQALVEFALVAPIFFLLLFAVIEGGRFIFYYETLNNATREGARFAIVNGSNSLLCPQGPTQPPGWQCDLTGEAVTPQWLDGYNNRDMRVRVEALYTYSTLIPIVPLPQISIRAESTLVINN
jgi:hypothetical protein